MELKLETLDLYYRKNRQVGHTTAMLNGAKSDPNVLVLIAHQAQERWVDLPNSQVINIYNLDRLRGRNNPILIDHYALQVMFSQVRAELLKKDEYIEKLEEKVDKLLKTQGA